MKTLAIYPISKPSKYDEQNTFGIAGLLRKRRSLMYVIVDQQGLTYTHLDR